MVDINPLAWEFITANAREYTEEVYGWLLGYFENGEPRILGAYDCQKFLEQTLISANPDPKEQLQLGFSLPNGIGIIGIYHSHPADSNIFHSHIDTDTILDITNIVPNFVSIVTNGTDIQCFMFVDKESQALKKVSPRFMVPELPPSTRFHVNVDLLFPEGEVKPDAPRLTSRIAHIFNKEWESRRFFAPKSNKALASNTTLRKIPPNPQTKMREIGVYSPSLKSNNAERTSEGTAIHGTIEVDIFHKKGDSIEDIDLKVQNALRDQLTQRIFKGYLNKTTGTWELAPTYTIHFWAVPLTAIFSRESEREEAQNYLNAWIQRLSYVSTQSIQKDLQLKTQFDQTFADLIKLAKKYDLSDLASQLQQTY